MITSRRGGRSEAVRQGAEHTLFVEGEEDSRDAMILESLLERKMPVKSFSTSSAIKSAANIMFKHYPKYYFLDPEYLAQSDFCVKPDEVEKKILSVANERLFFDVANLVIIYIREELKENWLEKFSSPLGFGEKESALKQLKNKSEFEGLPERVRQKITPEELEKRFLILLDDFTGKSDDGLLVFGSGRWLELMQGKEILRQVLNSNCFQVKEKKLQGEKRIKQILKNLLSKPKQPDDFHKLKELLTEKINQN